jgi:lantibiotic modifying enzyme
LRDGRFRATALEAIDPLRGQLRKLAGNPDKTRALRFKLGGMVGLGAYVYSFLRIGQWLDEPEILEEARRIATLITPARIAEDTSLDVMHGSAGAVLGLTALHLVAPEALPGSPAPLEIAFDCGLHLLRQRTARPRQPQAWPASGRMPWCGFAHGAAGIAYALMRLYEQTGHEDFRQAAREGLEFERFHYDPEARNWRDLRSPERRFMTAWCHGAPGIALGRLGIPAWSLEPDLAEEIRIGLDTTSNAAESDRDFLCCGNMGRVEVLLYGHQRLRNERLLQDAEELAWRALAKAHSSGGRYRWFGDSPDDRFSPSFFSGAAGLGYTLLRLADPLSLPCVLLLE